MTIFNSRDPETLTGKKELKTRSQVRLVSHTSLFFIPKCEVHIKPLRRNIQFIKQEISPWSEIFKYGTPSKQDPGILQRD